MEGIFPAWGRILQGYRPNLSIEITRECPLRCPGCYAYGDDHLGGDVTLRRHWPPNSARVLGGLEGARRALCQTRIAKTLDPRREARRRTAPAQLVHRVD